MNRSQEPPQAAIAAFALDPESLAPLPGGHINLTFAARTSAGADCILQRVNPIFPAVVNDDIEQVTRHLAAHNIPTPVLLPTQNGRNRLETDGQVWRLLTRIPGATRETLETEQTAAEAGRALGRFHAGLADFSAPLAHARAGVHDLPRHLAALAAAVAQHREHPAHTAVAALAAEIGAAADRLEPITAASARLVHGDPKISNVIFDAGRAVCLIDLDTIGRAAVAVELGDALRSWCNAAAEDSPQASFSLARCRAALTGYSEAAPGLLTRDEWLAVPNAAASIAVELAARFAADALNEAYFGWDRERFASASAHNRARAAAQLALGRDIERQLDSLRDLVMTLA